MIAIKIISSVGVAIGAGSTPSISIFAICRNPIIPNVLIRRALIGSPPLSLELNIIAFLSMEVQILYRGLIVYSILIIVL